MPELVVNGKKRAYQEADFPRTVGALVDGMDLDRAAVVAAIDGRIVPRDEFDRASLGPGSKVELVRFVHPLFAWAKVAGFLALQGSLAVLVGVSLWAVFRGSSQSYQSGEGAAPPS